jgi:fructose-specific phosphotransferase system IIA component
MVFAEYLHDGGIIVHSPAKTRWDIIHDLVTTAVEHSFIPRESEEEVRHALIVREKTMTTGIGKNVAIPHCKVSCIKEIVIMMATSVKGVNFEAIDNLPAKIIVLLLVPTSKADKHVKILSTIARVLSDDEFKDKLDKFDNAQDLLSYIVSYEGIK